jgi:flavin reductase (DIM6/NTAB) family NADH-FMN oxidoreductase RutF
MPVDPSEFRRVIGHFATGVTVVTTHDGNGELFGLTANAVCSVSLDPPLLLVCVDKAAESFYAFAASGCFTINILSSAQEALSRRFAKSGGDKFTGVGYRLGANGAATLDDALGILVCEIRHSFDAGDHVIHIGEVIEVSLGSEIDPLLFYRGGYRNLSP